MDEHVEAALMIAGAQMKAKDDEIARLRADLAEAVTALPQAVRNERERLRAAIEAKRCTPMFPGGHSFNYGVEAALDCVKA